MCGNGAVQLCCVRTRQRAGVVGNAEKYEGHSVILESKRSVRGLFVVFFGQFVKEGVYQLIGLGRTSTFCVPS